MIRHIAFGMVVCSICLPTLAQPAPAPRRAVGGGGVGGGGFMVAGGGGGNARFRQQTLDAVKDKLELSDDEWEKILPKVEKVLDAKRNTQSGAGMSWSSMNGAAPVMTVSQGKIDTPLGKAMEDVRAAADDKDMSAEEVAKRLATLKEEREKARAEYEAAQKELSDVLTPHQQAILATMAILE